jgi:DNA-binding response OmpR family regulator
MQHNTVFEFAVLDIDLPDGNGVSLAEHLLRRGLVNQVVFFTATREASTLLRATEMGPVVDKALGVEHLMLVIDRHMPAASSAQVAPTASDSANLFCLNDSPPMPIEGRPGVAVQGC